MDAHAELLAQGNQHYRAGQLEDAKRLYSQCLQATPASPFLWYLLAAVEDGPLAGHLAGPLSDLGQHARHLVAGLFTGRQIVLALICVAVIVVLLIIPVIGENLFNAASAGAERSGVQHASQSTVKGTSLSSFTRS